MLGSVLWRLRHPLQTSLKRGLGTTVARRGGGHSPFDTWVYRTNTRDPPKKFVNYAEAAGTFFWFWILYHLYHDYGHLWTEFPYPDPSQWTDEELGIPPEDAD